ncbi:prephenate dehydrogenase/arogenate dehydrogenase family protein [Aminithiophilus ramosus]|uniref:Prephenate dehydrogenase/arogenate dehydrogenase family protein n=1 Tax=Aminithiophilus ramosus TaxID=3029084 RepID=A0A9Q7EYA7_9BACT|nr:prephenate dehydrogenase/arogenate dehydrogenase family protein [Aminithiophilus ramosus]QTX31796.1 prephenate dehydrogenase/arogenate dehydrogenase family protein [Aminithiophilus ramosus]
MRLGDRHLGIVGTGLIGGSLGLALRGRAASVLGWDLDGDALRRALVLGAVDEAASSLEALCSRCDAVVLALPPRHVVGTAEAIFRSGALPVVFNAASVQARAFRVLSPLFSGRYAGFHPMAGRERGGIDNADGELFRGAFCAVVADERTDGEVVDLARELARIIGAESGLLGPDDHDGATACVSHLPLLTATALALAAGEELDRRPDFALLAGGGFRDTTRVAAGPAWMTADLWAENEALEGCLDRLIATLQQMRRSTADEMEDLARLGASRREAALSRTFRRMRP